MKIINMNELNESQLRQAAQILTDELPIGWPSLSDALEEIDEITALCKEEPEALFLAAVEDDEVIGWCGILPSYDGHVYELHPLAVRRDRQGKGIGAKLVGAVEAAAREKGGLTLWLGADDEKPSGETSLANTDLYDDLSKLMQDFKPGTHQSAFYLKLGFKIIGVMPDANGIGKPDIFFAKKL